MTLGVGSTSSMVQQQNIKLVYNNYSIINQSEGASGRHTPQLKSRNVVVMNGYSNNSSSLKYPFTPNQHNGDRNQSISKLSNRSSFIEAKQQYNNNINNHSNSSAALGGKNSNVSAFDGASRMMKRNTSMVERDFIKTLKGVVSNQSIYKMVPKASEEVMKSCQKLQRKVPTIPQFEEFEASQPKSAAV